MVIWTYGYSTRQVAMVSSQNCGTCKVKPGSQKIYFHGQYFKQSARMPLYIKT